MEYLKALLEKVPNYKFATREQQVGGFIAAAAAVYFAYSQHTKTDFFLKNNTD